MAVHHCMTYPCPTCNTSVGSIRPLRISTSGSLPARLEFFTWAEAIAVAQAAAPRAHTKPKVGRDLFGKWVVAYYYVPIAVNGAA